ncbi:MAG: molecular chaperone HtpG, partial [Cyanobacteria bacterium RYN_339]|nr:molecular chaperone HtpG [Cyanobacteria bacterium RYN_339]
GLDLADPFRIDVKVDAEAKTLTISDNGIGMSAEEVKKYLNQVAFSGAAEFMEHYKLNEESQQIIGHFGLGFYSAFMVSDKVEVITRSYKGGEASHWESEGGLEYKLGPAEREARGTDVVLHLGEHAHEFLEDARVRHVLEKYCKFLPVDIHLNGEHINEQAPLWTKSPSSLTNDDYLNFFRANYPYEDDPLFWIHLNVDYPFRLQGILYFPTLRHEMDASKGQIQLYCNQVFVADNTQEVIPKFLTVLKGMIDCPDIPLNVSRSQLQNDPYVKKIAGHITKKVADRLVQLHKNNREEFEGYWKDINPFVKFGMLDDQKFYEAAKDVVIFESSNGGYTTLADYAERNNEKQKGRVYYAEAGDAQATYLQLFKAQGLEALLTHSVLDSHFIQFLEQKQPELRWTRVDAAVNEHLVETDESAKVVDAEGKTSDDRLKELVAAALHDDNLEVQVQALKTRDVSGLITQSEQERRMKEMSALWQKSIDLPSRKTLVLNSNSPVVQRLLSTTDAGQREDLASHIYDLARLAHEGLKGEELAKFIARSHRLIAPEA